MAVPYTFGSATTSIPLSQLDSNFATAITLGNTAVQLGNTITTLTGVTNLASSGALTLGSNGNTTAITINTSQAVSIGTTNVGGTLNTTTTSGNWGEIIYDSANNASMLAFRNNSGAAAGNISLSSAGATSLLMSSVAGVNFPATQVASSDANTLDDYEEGTWTPVVTPASGSLTSYTSVGNYIKIGQVVYLHFSTTFTNAGTASGALNFSGLPFQPIGANTGTNQQIPIVREVNQTGLIYGGYITASTSAGSITNLTNGGVVWANNYAYTLNAVYQTSS